MGDLPTLRVIKPASMLKYQSPFEDMSALSAKDMSDFVELVLADKVEPYWKSDEIPATNDGPLTTIVGKEYDKIVNDSSKDVVVLYTHTRNVECLLARKI